MFTQPAPAPTSPGLSTSATTGNLPSSSDSNSSSSRTSRLRGLSYFRNYTQTHILSRDHSNNISGGGNGASSLPNRDLHLHLQQPSPTSAGATTSTSTATTTTRPLSTSFAAATNSFLSRSISYSPTTSSPSSPLGGPNPSPSSRTNRFSLLLSPTTSKTSTSSTQQQHQSRHKQKPLQHSLASSTSGSDLQPLIAKANTNPPPSSSTSSSGSALHLAPSVATPGRRSTESAIVVPPIVTTTTAHGTTAGTAETRTVTTATTAAAATASATATATQDERSVSANMTRTRSATTTDAMSGAAKGEGIDVLPSIRLSAFYDARAPRPSLSFSPVSRTLPTGTEVIRVGRYSERDNNPLVPTNVPSAAPVGFKSKVVSRRHCEFWYEGGKWYIKDVKSSSGTFLNHIRLSPPGTESKPFPVNDGDIVQLGIDFKGGEEMIFRCVKMRLELNRGWQNKLNTFNMATHKRLRNMTASTGNDNASGSYSQDCSICLNRIAPCQCLFVAPCSHTWHYKCIRALLSSPQYPIFQCPNCRAAADLEADIEESEEWEQLDSEEGEKAQQEGASLQVQGGIINEAPPRKSRESARSVRSQRSARIKEAVAAAAAAASGHPPQHPTPPALLQGDIDAQGDVTMLLDPPEIIVPSSSANGGNGIASRPPLSQHATSDPMPIPASSSLPTRAASGTHPYASRDGSTRTPSPTGGGGTLANGHGSGHEGPITPRNDAGPWVFDGSGMRITSLEAAVTADEPEIRDAPMLNA